MIQLQDGSFTMTELPANVKVGKYCSIASGVHFHHDGTHLYEENRKVVFTTNWDQPPGPRDIIIGNDVWIGQNALILEGITIGNGAIIGSGAVVAKDIPAYAVVIGNPAIIKKFRFTPEQIEKLEEIKWWDWDRDVIDSRKEDMKDIDIFLEKYYEE